MYFAGLVMVLPIVFTQRRGGDYFTQRHSDTEFSLSLVIGIAGLFGICNSELKGFGFPPDRTGRCNPDGKKIKNVRLPPTLQIASIKD